MIVSKANPLFRRELRNLPAAPLGDRIVIRQMPIKETSEAGLIKPDVAKERQFGGVLLAAGDSAADKLYDFGCEIGDEIWFGKYAGVVEEWQHIVRDGNQADCPHDGAWEFVPKTDEASWALVPPEGYIEELRACRSCGALRVSERIVVANVDDILLNVDLQVRLERGIMRRIRGQDADGRTRYYISRNTDSFSFTKEVD